MLLLRLKAALIALVVFSGTSVQAGERRVELVMFELGTCIYCAVWNDAVGRTYADTVPGQRAPLRRVSLTDPRPDDLTHVVGIRMTPTFVLLDEGREVGRIQGYANAELFWSELGRLLAKMTAER